MNKLTVVLSGLSLVVSVAAWAQGQEPTFRTEQWFISHPSEIAAALDWCESYNDEDQRKMLNQDYSCGNVVTAYGYVSRHQPRQ